MHIVQEGIFWIEASHTDSNTSLRQTHRIMNLQVFWKLTSPHFTSLHYSGGCCFSLPRMDTVAPAGAGHEASVQTDGVVNKIEIQPLSLWETDDVRSTQPSWLWKLRKMNPNVKNKWGTFSLCDICIFVKILTTNPQFEKYYWFVNYVWQLSKIYYHDIFTPKISQ